MCSPSQFKKMSGGIRDRKCLLPIKMHCVFFEFNIRPFKRKHCFMLLSVSSVLETRFSRLLIVIAGRNWVSSACMALSHTGNGEQPYPSTSSCLTHTCLLFVFIHSTMPGFLLVFGNLFSSVFLLLFLPC